MGKGVRGFFGKGKEKGKGKDDSPPPTSTTTDVAASAATEVKEELPKRVSAIILG